MYSIDKVLCRAIFNSIGSPGNGNIGVRVFRDHLYVAARRIGFAPYYDHLFRLNRFLIFAPGFWEEYTFDFPGDVLQADNRHGVVIPGRNIPNRHNHANHRHRALIQRLGISMQRVAELDIGHMPNFVHNVGQRVRGNI